MSTTHDGADERHDDALLRVVERLGLMLTEAGIPRMPARVFAYVLAEDSDRYTAGELAAGLRVSPAAISGAVRYLVRTGLLDKGREPGARSDFYRIYDDDVWSGIFMQQIPLLRRWEEISAEAVKQLGSDTPGGRRLRETQAYFRFLRTELLPLQERWQQEKDELVARLDADPAADLDEGDTR